MNKSTRKYFLPFLLIWLIPCQLAWGLDYEKPNKIDIVVFPKVTYDQNRDIFTYIYSLTSTPKSIQEVHSFSVVTDKNYPDANSPDGWEVHKSTSPGLPPMVDWTAGWGDLPEGKVVPSHGNIDPSPFNIKSGNSLTGFSFESKGLPGVTTFFSEGFVKIPDVTEEPVEEGPHSPRDFGRDAFKGGTVGPVAVSDTSLGGLIDRLISLKDSMPGYGWITNQGIINSLNVKLNSAKQSILKGNNKAAQNQLNAFINELEAQKGTHVNEHA